MEERIMVNRNEYYEEKLSIEDEYYKLKEYLRIIY